MEGVTLSLYHMQKQSNREESFHVQRFVSSFVSQWEWQEMMLEREGGMVLSIILRDSECVLYVL